MHAAAMQVSSCKSLSHVLLLDHTSAASQFAVLAFAFVGYVVVALQQARLKEGGRLVHLAHGSCITLLSFSGKTSCSDVTLMQSDTVAAYEQTHGARRGRGCS